MTSPRMMENGNQREERESEHLSGQMEVIEKKKNNVEMPKEFHFFKKAMYRGEWLNDKREGNGIMEFDDGSRYEGEWKNDRREGQGTKFYITGAIYKGEWKDGKRDGKGMMKYSNGDIFEGFF